MSQHGDSSVTATSEQHHSGSYIWEDLESQLSPEAAVPWPAEVGLPGPWPLAFLA